MQTTYDMFRIGIDLGGTKTEIILIGPDDAVLLKKRLPTPRQHGYDAILDCIARLVDNARSLIPEESQYTIGIGIPGSINAETGLVQNANTTCLIGRPLATDLRQMLGCAMVIENDANCFTFAECRAGAGQGCKLVFGVIMGTGCGGGICLDGRIIAGRNHIAGEWGHVSVDPQGIPCYCGSRGCIETKISGGGVEAAFYKHYGRIISMKSIVQGARSGDPECRETFSRFLDDFGRCLGGLISVLDPDAVVLGGGLSHIDELYTLGAEQVRKYAFHGNITTPIVRNALGDSAGVFGAAWLGAEAIRSS